MRGPLGGSTIKSVNGVVLAVKRTCLSCHSGLGGPSSECKAARGAGPEGDVTPAALGIGQRVGVLLGPAVIWESCSWVLGTCWVRLGVPEMEG